MILSDILGVNTNCKEAGMASVGSFACPFKFQLPDGLILIKKGFKVPAATDFDKAYLLGLVQTGIAIPLLRSFSFEPINEDDVLETSVTGVNDLARKGLTSLMFTYKKGIEYEKAMERLTSFGAFDVWVVDTSGNFLGIDKDGDFGGWSAGLVLAKSKTWNTGSESEGKAIEVQLTQPGERKDTTWIEASALDFFAPTEIDGINGTYISFADENGAVPPAASDTDLKVKVYANDKSTPVVGLTTTDFQVKLGGTVTPATVVEDGNGFYTLTVGVTAGSVGVTLHDDALSVDAVDVSEVLFAGSVSATAA